jgi:UDP-N-acetylmuramyl pentapeptide phosphotransferase/UDP-N-acetylglucosamine-1-phosphate transferase
MRLATMAGAIDEPDSGRRIHLRPIPRAGGASVLAAFVLVGLLDSIHFRPRLENRETGDAGQQPVAYAIEVLSLLAAVAAPLRTRNEGREGAAPVGLN